MSRDELLQSLSPYLKSRQGQIWMLLLATVIILVVATLVWQVIDSVKLFQASSETLQTDTSELSDNTKPVLKTITEKPIFGKAPVPGRVNTHFHLAGVLYAKDAKLRKAIIGSPGNAPKIYAVGEQLKEGGKLYQVNADHVLLLINGQLSKVLLLWEGVNGKGSSKLFTPNMVNNPTDDNSDNSSDSSSDTDTNTDTDTDTDTDMATAATAAAAAAAETGAVEEADWANRPEAQAWRDRIKELQQKYQSRPNLSDPNAGGSAQRPMPPRRNFMRDRY